MNNKVSEIMKFILCAGIVIGAPFLASAAVDVAVAKVEHSLEVTACKKIADLDNLPEHCIDKD
jgi:hypothetical protein